MRRAIILFMLLLSVGGTLVLLSAAGEPWEELAFAAAQHKSGASLSGVVIGPDDKPVPHASVSYQSSAGRAPHAVRADAKGRFTISKLQTDNYDVRASSKGIFSDWEKNVSLRPGQSKSVTLRLLYSRRDAKDLAKNKAKPKPKQ